MPNCKARLKRKEFWSRTSYITDGTNGKYKSFFIPQYGFFVIGNTRSFVYMDKIVVSSSPHIKSSYSTRQMMLEVVIALVPALVVGVVFFGLYALLIVLLSVGSAVLGEFLYNRITKKKQSISDCSAIVTGLILGLNLPPAVPFYIPIAGGFFAIMIVKMLFGGLGKNFANPAATARIFLLLTWASQMTTFVPALTYTGGNLFSEFTKYFSGIASTGGLDGMIASTPLSGKGDMNLLHLFWGNVSGCIGETSAFALLLGGTYLMIRRIVDWKIPVIYLGSFVFFTLVFTGSAYEILPQLLSGGLMFGAFFMATDYATSPNTVCGTILYALALGFITVVLRTLTSMPEGVSYAIVLMNLAVPLLDKYILPHPFGSKKKPILLLSLMSIMGAMVLTVCIWSGVFVSQDKTAVRDFAGGEYSANVIISKRRTGKISVVYRDALGSGTVVYRVAGYGGYKGETEKKKGYVEAYVAIGKDRIYKIKLISHDQPQDAKALQESYYSAYHGKTLAALTGEGMIAPPPEDQGTADAVFNAVLTAAKCYQGVL